jgi:hypothetical protein
VQLQSMSSLTLVASKFRESAKSRGPVAHAIPLSGAWAGGYDQV